MRNKQLQFAMQQRCATTVKSIMFLFLLSLSAQLVLKIVFILKVSSSSFGDLMSVELVPDGENIAVTNSNRERFVSLYVDHLLVKSVERQFRAFSRGFHKVRASI